MIIRHLITLISTSLFLLTLVPTTVCSKPGGDTSATAGSSAAVDDIIARVGDEEINFSMINTMLNSSAMVGVSIPALGTPERNKVIITLLDKVISANLL